MVTFHLIFRRIPRLTHLSVRSYWVDYLMVTVEYIVLSRTIYRRALL
ncbi:MAG: hypothetical protein K2H48_06200 [Duncaniella sp.]|nr:hypothetical protein [Duncaniella sp.]